MVFLSWQFLENLNRQDSFIQYTIKLENNQKQLNFLDITITNNGTNSYDFKIFRKPAIANVQIKSNSNMAPNVSVSVFKGFLSRAYRICSERYIGDEIQFLIDVFTENSYERKTLEKITKNYLKELQNPRDNNKDTSEDINKVVKISWIPIIGPKLRQGFKKNNIKTIFTSGPNLKSLLCRNKTKLFPNSYPGVYELKCTCNSAYFGETKKKILTRTIENQQDSFKGKWDNSGATEHTLTCHGQFNWIHPKTIAREKDYRNRKIREALEIKKAKFNKKIKVLNMDEGNLVKTNTWTPLLANINEM